MTGLVAVAVVAATVTVIRAVPTEPATPASPTVAPRAGLEAAVLGRLSDVAGGGRRVTSADPALDWTDQEQGAHGSALDLTGKTLYVAAACDGGGSIAIKISDNPDITLDCAAFSTIGPVNLTELLRKTGKSLSLDVVTTAGHPRYLVKQIALQQSTAGSGITRLPSGVQSPVPDQGSASDITAVRASLVDALTAQEDQLSRNQDGSPRASQQARQQRLESVETATLATSDLKAMGYLTSNDVPFRSAHFTAARWDGVTVDGDSARAYVLGRNTYLHWDGTTDHDPEFQYKALLLRDPAAPHGWSLTAQKAASNDQG